MKRLFSILALLFVSMIISFSQSPQRTAYFYVHDGNQPLIGATIIITNSNLGVVTDVYGRAKLEIPSPNCKEYTVCMVGYKPQTHELLNAPTILYDINLFAYQI